jgi:hypothetical protein
MLHEKRLKADKEYAAIIRAQHALLFMAENLTDLRNQKLDAHKDQPDRHIRMTALFMTEKHVSIDLDSLSFLFRPKMRELIARCFFAERSYLSALDALRDRNTAWTAITNQPGAVSDINPSTGVGTLTISNDQARQLKTLTDLLYRAVEIGESLNKEAAADLRKNAKLVFDNRDFLIGDMVRKAVPSAEDPKL